MNVESRNILLAFLVAIVLGIIGYRGLTKPPASQPGSALAARFLAAKYVGTSLKIDPVHVYEPPEINGAKAIVKTVVGANKGCTVNLIRSESDAEYGWLVERMACGDSK